MIKENEKDKILKLSIKELNLETRTYRCLERVGYGYWSNPEDRIYTIGDLVKRTSEDLLKIDLLGPKKVEEIINKLNEFGLHLRDSEEQKLMKEKERLGEMTLEELEKLDSEYQEKIDKNSEIIRLETIKRIQGKQEFIKKQEERIQELTNKEKNKDE